MNYASDPFAAGLTTRSTRTSHASSWPALAAFGVAGLSVVLIPFGGPLAIGVAGYAMAALLTPILVVAYRALDRRAQRDIRYTRRQFPRRVSTLAIVIGLAAGVTHAWMIATEYAKR